MKKILLLGYAPPLFNKGQKTEAANYRTWQFLEPLILDGHRVCLAAVAEKPGQPQPEPDIPAAWQERLEYHQIAFGRPGWVKKLQSIHDRFQPDCVVAVNFYPCLYATRLHTRTPVWMDIYGDMLTIQQAASFRSGSNRGIPTTIQFNQRILEMGDVFSACGGPQGHMLVGELAMAGRLNVQSFGYPFVQVILPGAAPIELEPERRAKRPWLGKMGVSPDDFTVLWCGGYNTWTDIDTLFAALEWAMTANPKIHFVSVGASTYKAPDNVYNRFLERIGRSSFKDRYHMLGWRPWDEIPHYYAESDVGLNIDALHYETIYGTRTRLLEMMAAGLPVVTSLGSELSYQLEEKQAALVFSIGDWACLGENILRLSQNPPLRDLLSQRSLELARGMFSFTSTTETLRSWVKNPKHAPDHVERTLNDQLSELSYHGRAILRQTLRQLTGADK